MADDHSTSASSKAGSLVLKIVTPSKTLFSGEASEVILPGIDGEIGILPQHERFVGSLGVGPLRLASVKPGGSVTTSAYVLNGGFFQVSDNVLVVLAIEAIDATTIDTERVKGELTPLEHRLANMSTHEPDYESLSTKAHFYQALLEVSAVRH